MEPHLTATGCHLTNGITQGYQPPDTVSTPPLNPSQRGQYSIYLPRRDGRLSLPRWLVTYRNGLPAHRRSPIQALTTQHNEANRRRPIWPLCPSDQKKTVFGRESNSQPVDHKSDALTTATPSHQHQYVTIHMKHAALYRKQLKNIF